MGQSPPVVVLALFCASCSLIYNPSNIVKPSQDGSVRDMPVDVEVITDVNPSALALVDLGPAVLYEGQGIDNSRPCFLVVRGHQITDTATITVAPVTANPMVTLTLGALLVSPDHNVVSVPVTANVMETVNESAGDIALTVTVTQAGATPQTLPWVLKPLDQLEAGGTIDAANVKARYSRVAVSAGMPVSFTGMSRVVIVAMSSITFNSSIAATGTNQVAGPGGCTGGQASSPATCAGGGGAGTGGGGGGGGFAAKGMNGGGTTGVGAGGPATGDPLIATYDGHPLGSITSNAGGGGGGGAGSIGNGGPGGGGGGTVELTAGGDVTVGALTVDGGVGGNAGLGLGNASGGGGSGGVIVLRSGNNLVLNGVLSARGGVGGTTGNAGGTGADGRIRYDVPTTATIPGGTIPAPHRGLAFGAGAPTLTTMQRPSVMVIGTANDGYSYVVHDQDGNQRDTGTGRSLNTSGTDTFVPVLTAGDNELCVIVAGGIYADPEAKECIHIVFLPGAP